MILIRRNNKKIIIIKKSINSEKVKGFSVDNLRLSSNIFSASSLHKHLLLTLRGFDRLDRGRSRMQTGMRILDSWKLVQRRDLRARKPVLPEFGGPRMPVAQMCAQHYSLSYYDLEILRACFFFAAVSARRFTHYDIIGSAAVQYFR